MAAADSPAAPTTRERIVAAAREELAEAGAAALSTRAIARRVGIVSSAVFRYFPSRDALLTRLVLDSYRRLGAHLAEAELEGAPAARAWGALAERLRAWALSHPHEFLLIYGTPVPGYQAPPETIAAAGAVAEPFIRLGRAPQPEFEEAAEDAEGLRRIADSAGIAAGAAAAVLAELAALAGMIILELGGHFVGTADPADRLYAAVVRRQAASLGLA